MQRIACVSAATTTTVGTHQVNEGHNITAKDVTVLAREDNFWHRKAIKLWERHLANNQNYGYNISAVFLELPSCEKPPSWSHDIEDRIYIQVDYMNTTHCEEQCNK